MEKKTRFEDSRANAVGPCPYACDHKSTSGWCGLTACTNPEHDGSGTYVSDSGGTLWKISSGPTVRYVRR